ncbi:hypothetical protein TRV_00978 [Trichophyton verrucosum HKI 0517]|uniref:Uncharacterized protein n=1 Tax=Trichophyton verrucosum (strain HKI 0517) TaxID=663202 RepID=D4D1M7_TRIVH|nr:uncharacterized protein TRV_00978 [Trichophyton verrucosum HKI 0517]EFE44246.1 hypothetical protein TRV_00978 [Trichophyton verrucosum HKI 0517]
MWWEKLPIEAKPGWWKRNTGGYKPGTLNGRRNQAEKRERERTVEQESRRLAALLKRSGRARSNKARGPRRREKLSNKGREEDEGKEAEDKKSEGEKKEGGREGKGGREGEKRQSWPAGERLLEIIRTTVVLFFFSCSQAGRDSPYFSGSNCKKREEKRLKGKKNIEGQLGWNKGGELRMGLAKPEHLLMQNKAESEKRERERDVDSKVEVPVVVGDLVGCTE